jgi:hypothetical protein
MLIPLGSTSLYTDPAMRAMWGDLATSSPRMPPQWVDHTLGDTSPKRATRHRQPVTESVDEVLVQVYGAEVRA